MARTTINIPDEMLKEIDRVADENFCSRSVALRLLYRQWRSYSTSGCITLHHSASDLHPPDPDPARTGTDPEKKEERKNKEARLAPLDICTEILEDLNTRAGTAYRPRGKATRRLIAARIADGATVADFRTVNRKMTEAWKGTEWGRYLRPSTLYGPKFDDYLGQPEHAEQIDPGIARVLAGLKGEA